MHKGFRLQASADKTRKIVHPRPDCSVPMVNELRFRMLVMLRDPRASETSMRHAFLHGRSVQPEQTLLTAARLVSDAIGEGRAIEVYATALLHPERVSAVAGLSVPFRPTGDMSMLDVLRQVYAERFFYMLYFQQPDLPEAELETDIPTSLRTIYYSASGDAPPGSFMPEKPVDARFLDGMINPDVLPEWMSDSDLQIYAEAFATGGFRGPINRYRAQDLDFEASKAAVGMLLSQPSCFIGGERDLVREMFPGIDLYADIESGYQDLRINDLVAGAGHWVQQEAPQKTNAILERFVRSLGESGIKDVQ